MWNYLPVGILTPIKNYGLQGGVIYSYHHASRFLPGSDGYINMASYNQSAPWN